MVDRRQVSGQNRGKIGLSEFWIIQRSKILTGLSNFPFFVIFYE